MCPLVARYTRSVDKRNRDGMAAAVAAAAGREGNRQRRVVSGLVSFTITVINDPLSKRGAAGLPATRQTLAPVLTHAGGGGTLSPI